MLKSRQLPINKISDNKGAVVYVMSRDQRTQDNHALLAAQDLAKQNNKALYVLFIIKKVPSRSREHYEFMIEGLKDVSTSLEAHGIPFIMRVDISTKEIIRLMCEIEATAIFFDFSPLIGPSSLVRDISKEFKGSVTLVDTHNIIPAWTVSNKQEYAAYTMRSKVHSNLENYLIKPSILLSQIKPKNIPNTVNFQDVNSFIQSIPSCGIKLTYKAGENAANKLLKTFITKLLENYAFDRNNISHDMQSGFSPYLHFGHISSLRIALEVINFVNQPPLLFQRAKLVEVGQTPSAIEGMNSLLEEMIVRKELSDNYCYYNKNFLSILGAPDWAKKTLEKHLQDPRDFIYDVSEWENAKTHDNIWNTAQTELTKSGKIHGYMRMYWAKKILEWSSSPEDAIQTAIYLNDKYSIDGGDPNGYVGILWSIAGLHDRPWVERSVYGMIRFMNESGLRRKFDVDAYISRVQLL